MNKMLIATDYDGTLNQHGEISGFTRKAIDVWRASGRYFGVVTGRGFDFYETALENGIPFDYLIIYNGSVLLSAENEIIFQSLIPADTFALIEKLVTAYDDCEYCSHADGRPFPHFYATFPTDERAFVVGEELKEALSGKAAVFVNGPHINIGNCGTGKAEGVELILKHFALPPDSAAVAGDDYNDLDMIIRHSGWAITSGKPEVVAKAPHSCANVGELIYSLL